MTRVLSYKSLRLGPGRRRTYDQGIVVEELTTRYLMLVSTLSLCRFKSDEKTLADSLDYEKAEMKKLSEKNEDLLKRLQEANSAIQRLQGLINGKC